MKQKLTNRIAAKLDFVIILLLFSKYISFKEWPTETVLIKHTQKNYILHKQCTIFQCLLNI